MDVLAAAQDLQDTSTYHAFCRCRHCFKTSMAALRSIYSSNFPMARDNDGQFINGTFGVTIAPPVLPSADKAPDFVPAQIGAIFEEATRCEAIACFDAAGAMFRKVLDAATRSLIGVEPQSVDRTHENYISFKQAKDLKLRLDWLFERKRLPESLADLASCVHQDGNDAAHSVETIGADAAADLHDFTASILETLYTTPGRIAANVARRHARRGGA
jgi:hypothetical protein